MPLLVESTQGLPGEQPSVTVAQGPGRARVNLAAPYSPGDVVYVTSSATRLRGAVAVCPQQAWDEGLAELAGQPVTVAECAPPLVLVRWTPLESSKEAAQWLPAEVLGPRPDAGYSGAPLSPLRRSHLRLRAPGRKWAARCGGAVFGGAAVSRAARASSRGLMQERVSHELLELAARREVIGEWQRRYELFIGAIYQLRKADMEKRESVARKPVVASWKRTRRPLVFLGQRSVMGAQHVAVHRLRLLSACELCAGYAVYWPDSMPLPAQCTGGRAVIVRGQRLMRSKLQAQADHWQQQLWRFELYRQELVAMEQGPARYHVAGAECAQRAMRRGEEFTERQRVQRAVMERRAGEGHAAVGAAEQGARDRLWAAHIDRRNDAARRAMCREEGEGRAAVARLEDVAELEVAPGSWERLVRQCALEGRELQQRQHRLDAERRARVTVQFDQESELRGVAVLEKRGARKRLEDALARALIIAAEPAGREAVAMESETAEGRLLLHWAPGLPLPQGVGGQQGVILAEERCGRAEFAATATEMNEAAGRWVLTAQHMWRWAHLSVVSDSLLQLAEWHALCPARLAAEEHLRRSMRSAAERAARNALRRGFSLCSVAVARVTADRDRAEDRRECRAQLYKQRLALCQQAGYFRDRPASELADPPDGEVRFIARRGERLFDTRQAERVRRHVLYGRFADRVAEEAREREDRAAVRRRWLFGVLNLAEGEEITRRPAVFRRERREWVTIRNRFFIGRLVACDAANRRPLYAEWGETLALYAMGWPLGMPIPGGFPGARVLLLREERQSRVWLAGSVFDYSLWCRDRFIRVKEHSKAATAGARLLRFREHAWRSFLWTSQRVEQEQLARGGAEAAERAEAEEYFWAHVEGRYVVGVSDTVTGEHLGRVALQGEQDAGFEDIAKLEKKERETYWRQYWGALLAPATMAAKSKFAASKRARAALGSKKEVADWDGSGSSGDPCNEEELWRDANRRAEAEPWRVSLDSMLRKRVFELVEQGRCQGRRGAGVSLKLVREHLEAEFSCKLSDRKADIEAWVVAAVNAIRARGEKVETGPVRRQADASAAPTMAQLEGMVERIVQRGECRTEQGVSLKQVRTTMEAHFGWPLDKYKTHIQKWVAAAITRMQ
eukprot:TRINITY_DN12238_c0_g4_i1.p1 TRINITY_DN12238_c0_g4~~TRINITY_DN12238_c0_g4_i1.p1  ORF type:complete len:1135 (+),score=352.26 TRINITY_DN12238_c0_g4_i1:91-3495(+)